MFTEFRISPSSLRKRNEMTVSTSSLTESKRSMSKQRRSFSLQVPGFELMNKMGRKLSLASSSRSTDGSSRSSSNPGSLNDLSDPDYRIQGKKGGGNKGKKTTGRRNSQPAVNYVDQSEEELNRRFNQFDTYFNGFDEPPRTGNGQRTLAVPNILVQTADDDRSIQELDVGRQRSQSDTRSQLSRFLKFSRIRRGSIQSESPSPTSVAQSIEFPAMVYERRGSFQNTSTSGLGVVTPVHRLSLQQLPEGVQVHHATPTRSLSPEPDLSILQGSLLTPSSADPFVSRNRSATFSSTDSQVPIRRERSVSFSVVQQPQTVPPLDNDQKRRSSFQFWPPFGRTRTKSRSVDQSLAAAFDVDVIGGLSRLAGSALGSSTDSGGGGRPGSPVGVGERRSSGSGGSNSRLVEDTLAYTVQSNDTLTSLAARFDTTPSELVAINKLHSRLIFPGQVLQVPRKDADAGRSGGGGGAGLESGAEGVADGGEPGSLPNVSLNVSIRSSSSNSNINDFGRRDSNGGYSSPTAERPNEHAFLDSLRPPGSPRFNRTDLSFTSPSSGGAGQMGTTVTDLSNVEREAINQQLDLTEVDVEAERLRDRSAYEKFLKIHVRHITDGQGVVAGVLLVTPNTVMFDPNVSDPLVIEHGAEAYGVIAPMEFVVNAALYPDIAHMRLADSKGQPDQPITDPIYFPTNCPLHRKYSILKKKAHLQDEKEDQIDAVQTATQLDPAAGILAIASDIQRRWSEGEDLTEREETAQQDATGCSKVAASQVPEPAESGLQGTEPKEMAIPDPTAETAALVTVTSEPVCSIIPPPSVVEAAHQSGHVIRLHVKNEPTVLTTIPDVVATGPERKDEIDLVDKSAVCSGPPSVSSIRIVSSMDKTPSAERDDELCISEELNVTDDDDKDEAFHSSTGSGYEAAINEAMLDETEYRARHFSAGASSAMGPHQHGAARSRALHSSIYRQSRHASGSGSGSGSEPIAAGRPQSSSPAPNSSSPESRGQRMLKRLSYPLVWMGESLSTDSKENSPVLPADKDPNAESVFSKVFSSNHPDHSVELSCDNSMTSQATEDGWMMPDLSEFRGDLSKMLVATAAAIAIGTIDGGRRLSTENSLKLDSRLVPNLFRGSKDQPANMQPGTAGSGAQPKLGYRSMVSVDDVPELFASLDKLIPKPAQPCDAPPLYLRLRMGKPLNRKGAMTTPIMSYGKKKMKPEYWFSIPRDKADSLCRFFLLWSPDVYGEPGDAETVAKRGFELITEDLEWEEQSPVRRLKPAKKSKGTAGPGSKKNDHDVDDDDDPLGVTAELAKESWERAKAPYVRLFTILKTQATLFESDQDEIVSLNEEVRRALYGSERLSALDLDSYLPDLIGPTEVLTDEYRKQLAKYLPARVEGYPWTLVFSTSQNGFSINSLYRKMIGIDSPILLVIEDTQGNVFGAITSCEIRVSESFYGTGESLLFVLNPKMQVYPWTGDNSYFIQGNNESLAFGAGDGRFGLWLDGDLNQGRTQTCKTFGNHPLSPDEDFWVKTLECWAFM